MIQFTGFEELIHQLGSLPQAMRDDAMVIVREETEGAAVEIAQAYHQKTGTLAKRVKTSYPSTTLLVGIVQSTAPHAHLYEFGTRDRKTKSGANRGAMWKGKKGLTAESVHKVTPVIAQKRRDRMVRRLTEFVRGLGFQVSGQ